MCSVCGSSVSSKGDTGKEVEESFELLSSLTKS
jgi:hypothetical protein